MDEMMNLTSCRLIVFFSKSILRHPQARSTFEDMKSGTHFQRFIPDAHPESLSEPEEIKRHIVGNAHYIG